MKKQPNITYEITYGDGETVKVVSHGFHFDKHGVAVFTVQSGETPVPIFWACGPVHIKLVSVEEVEEEVKEGE